MRSLITHDQTEVCANSAPTTEGDNVAFACAELRLKEHFSGWGAPFADIDDNTVREIAAVLKEHWRRVTASDTELQH